VNVAARPTASARLTAYKALSLADEATPLGAEDLELFAASAYLIGRNDDGIGVLDRAYHVYLDAGKAVSAARCAIWLGFGLIDAEEISRAVAVREAACMRNFSVMPAGEK
jgi:hypothetical protein